jgi:hypothetical protein
MSCLYFSSPFPPSFLHLSLRLSLSLSLSFSSLPITSHHITSYLPTKPTTDQTVHISSHPSLSLSSLSPSHRPRARAGLGLSQTDQAEHVLSSKSLQSQKKIKKFLNSQISMSYQSNASLHLHLPLHSTFLSSFLLFFFFIFLFAFSFLGGC